MIRTTFKVDLNLWNKCIDLQVDFKFKIIQICILVNNQIIDMISEQKRTFKL